MIGSRLAERLLENGHSLMLFSRSESPPSRFVDGKDVEWIQAELEQEVPDGILEKSDALINLAGTRIKGSRWSRKHKKHIYNSRVNTTRNLVKAMKRCGSPPPVFLSASAIGFYGDRGDDFLTEETGNGRGFLAGVTRDWEVEALKAEETGARVVLLRSSPVLAADDGALPEIVKTFKMGVGGVLGPGSQWMPWVHIEDEAAMITWALEEESVRGPLNVTAPEPRTNEEFMNAVSSRLGKNLLIRVPASALKLALGEMAREMLLASQRVVPEKALSAGYSFKFPALEKALEDLLVE